MKKELVIGDNIGESFLTVSCKWGDQERYVNVTVEKEPDDVNDMFDLAVKELKTLI